MSTAPKMPPDETLDILRRLEPALAGITSRLDKLETELHQQGQTIVKLGTDVARLEGRVSQLPTLVQIVGAVLGINAGIIALGFALAKLVSH